MSAIDEPPSYRFTSSRRIFDKRFEAFDGIPQPPRLSHDDYLQGSDSTEATHLELLLSASETFKNAKSVLDQLLIILDDTQRNGPLNFAHVTRDQVLSLVKVSISNSLFLLKLKSRSDSSKVAFDFTLNAHFCVFKFVE